MYFVHPQLKFNIGNLKNLLVCFLKRRDKKIQGEIEQMFPGKGVYFTDMGRSAFRLIVEKLGLEGSQMLVPAYICDIFFPLFKEYNITPVFLALDKETFNIKPGEIEQKVGPEVKSILVLHTYGLPADLDKILALAQKYNLKVIEDCAHSFGAKHEGRFVGNFGDAALFSLYKLFPTLRGGMAVLPGANTLTSDIRVLPKTKFSGRDFVSLLNCCSFCSFLFKKYAGRIAEKHIRREKVGRPSQINRVSLNIFAWQVRKLEEILEKRRELGLVFQKELKKMGFETQSPNGSTFTFLSALVPKEIDRDKFVVELRKKGVFLTRIWHTPIILNKGVQNDYKIDVSQFPNTMDVAKRIVNFPLQGFYTKEDIEKQVRAVKEIKGGKREKRGKSMLRSSTSPRKLNF